MWRDDAYLLDILIAARHTLEFSRDLTWEQFQQSRLHQHAIAKALENIGEAVETLIWLSEAPASEDLLCVMIFSNQSS